MTSIVTSRKDDKEKTKQQTTMSTFIGGRTHEAKDPTIMD
jgi:hypothetical protein